MLNKITIISALSSLFFAILMGSVRMSCNLSNVSSSSAKPCARSGIVSISISAADGELPSRTVRVDILRIVAFLPHVLVSVILR